MSQIEWFVFVILVPCWNCNRCPRKSGLSSLHYCLLFLSLCRTRSLSFLLKLSWMATLLGKLVILLFECVVGKCFVVFYVFSFRCAVCVGTLNLIASIPGPSILTFPKYRVQAKVCTVNSTMENHRQWRITRKYIAEILESKYFLLYNSVVNFHLCRVVL